MGEPRHLLSGWRPMHRPDGPGFARPLLFAFAVAGTVVLTNLLDFELAGMRIGVLNANLATSWSHRGVAAALVLGAALAARQAAQAVRLRLWWASVAAALTLLFVIELSPVHVFVDRLSYGKLVYVPLLTGLVICVLRLLDQSDWLTGMWAGLAALAASYAVHILGPAIARLVGWGTDSVAYQVKVGLKEGLELAGWLLLVVALWRGRAAAEGRPEVPSPPVRCRPEASPMGCRQAEQG